jgi:RNA recognition motif-containing protein
MNNKLFVGNLSYNVDEPGLQELFSQHGPVISTVIPKDRDTGRPRGFAFVEMQDQAGAEAAIRGLDGTQYAGREMKVSISQPKPRTFQGGRGGGGGGGSRY